MLSARPAGLPLDVDRGTSTKTPARGLTRTRSVLQENAVRNVPATVIGKGRKVVQNTPLQSKALQTDRVLNDPPAKQVGPSKPKDTPAARPLGDKTPFPNRTANQLLAAGAKVPRPALLDRPSSARKHERLPRSASKTFETPITNGKHWDVSDIDIGVDASVANQSIEEDNYDEIEYMPPKAEDTPYEPPFEMPNYREVGKSLMALIRSYTLDDDLPSNDITFTPDASEGNFFVAPVLPQQEIEDDSPFARSKPEPGPKLQPSAKVKQPSAGTKPAPRSTVQRTTTRSVTLANSRMPPIVRRPPTATSIRPQTTTARTSVSQPVTRAPTSQSMAREPVSRATTRAPSTARSTPLVRTSGAQLSRAASVSRLVTKPPARPAAPTVHVKSKSTIIQPSTTPTAKTFASTFDPTPIPNNARPRSGTITKAAFESNTHVVVHIRNNSLEDVKKDLEGLIVFEDAFDEDDGFRFDV